METNEVIATLRQCNNYSPGRCKNCPAYNQGLSCIDRLHAAALNVLETQQKQIDELEQERRWIPVTERLPESGVRVIVCRGDKVEQGVFLGVNGWWKVYGTNTKKVTHWMPLPEPPKEGS